MYSSKQRSSKTPNKKKNKEKDYKKSMPANDINNKFIRTPPTTHRPLVYIPTTSVCPYGSTYAPTGLTSKEKSFVINACQRHSTRYSKLKALAAQAMEDNKVYIVYGGNMAIRRALNSRGWVEKVSPQHMNLSKIHKLEAAQADTKEELERLLLSNLVEKHPPNFMWKVKDYGKQSRELNDINHTIINKLKMDTVWASKQGLCSSVKNNTWFHIAGEAETSTPRTYNSFDADDKAEFAADFKLTACTSLLKWLLHRSENSKEICTSTGKISINIIIFALNRCKEYILKKQNKDIDRNWRPASDNMWNVFLQNYYRIITEAEIFEEDVDQQIPLCLAYAKILLREIEKYRPLLKSEGFLSIWIVKPGHCSRGRGIRLASNLNTLNKLLHVSSRRVVQKYIEDPLLIHETKFDIRQYYLVTSTFPLIIWMYKDCYLKFSSQKYSLMNYHESIHLTNHAVQRKYKNCKNRHPDLPLNNMWSLEKYKEYLETEDKADIWNKVIYPGMKKCIIGVMLSSQDHMSMCKNRFELYGCDFVLDKDYTPWLIEINSCPDLSPTTKVTAKSCAAVVEDIVKVVIDRPRQIRAGTGNFECVYKQSITIPTYHRIAELVVCGSGLPNNYFCKSSIVHEPLPADVDLERECDIEATFNHLKALYAKTDQLNTDAYEKELAASEKEFAEEIDNLTSQLDLLLEMPSTTTVGDSEDGDQQGSRESVATVVSAISKEHSQIGYDSQRSCFSEMYVHKVMPKPISFEISSSAVDLNRNVGCSSEKMACLNVVENIIHSMSKKITTDSNQHFTKNLFNISTPEQCTYKLDHNNIPPAATKSSNI